MKHYHVLDSEPFLSIDNMNIMFCLRDTNLSTDGLSVLVIWEDAMVSTKLSKLS